MEVCTQSSSDILTSGAVTVPPSWQPLVADGCRDNLSEMEHFREGVKNATDAAVKSVSSWDDSSNKCIGNIFYDKSLYERVSNYFFGDVLDMAMGVGTSLMSILYVTFIVTTLYNLYGELQHGHNTLIKLLIIVPGIIALIIFCLWIKEYIEGDELIRFTSVDLLIILIFHLTLIVHKPGLLAIKRSNGPISKVIN